MQYPGHTRHRRLSRFAALSGAVLLFATGLVMAGAKTGMGSVRPTFSPPAVGSVLGTESIFARFTLFDAQTQQALVGKPVALVFSQSDCIERCAAPSPKVILTDETGSLMIDYEILKQEPKVYISGYRIDRYFNFLKPAEPYSLTVYDPLPATKNTYDIRFETIPVGITPAGTE